MYEEPIEAEEQAEKKRNGSEKNGRNWRWKKRRIDDPPKGLQADDGATPRGWSDVQNKCVVGIWGDSNSERGHDSKNDGLDKGKVKNTPTE